MSYENGFQSLEYSCGRHFR